MRLPLCDDTTASKPGIDREDALDLAAAVRSLAPRERLVIEYQLARYTLDEIAELVGVSRRAVKRSRTRAIRSLRDRLRG